MKQKIARNSTRFDAAPLVSLVAVGLTAALFLTPCEIVVSAETTTIASDVSRQLELANNALAGLEKTLAGLPARILLAKVAERKPKIEPIGPECVNISWTVVVSYNYTNYTKQILPALRNALSELAGSKSASDVYANVIESEHAPAYGVLRLAKSKVWGPGYFKWPDMSCDKESEFPLLLHVGRGEGTTRLAWYVLNQRYAPLFDRLSESKPSLKVELLDAQKQVLKDENIDLSQFRYLVDYPAVYSQTSVRPKFSAELDLASFPSFLTKRPVKDGSHHFYVLEPQIRIGVNDKFSGFSGDSIAFSWKTKLAVDQAKRLSGIQFCFVDTSDQARQRIGTSVLAAASDISSRTLKDSVQPSRPPKMDVAQAGASPSVNSSPATSVVQPSLERSQPPVAVVRASGVGIDSDKALRDALRNAVLQAVGAVVDAETLVKNENVIKDQILTYSDGYVERFDKLKEGKRDDGLFEIRINATIKRRQLVEKLKTSKVISTTLDGQSLFAEVLTQLDASQNAATLLKKAVEGLPLNLLVAKVDKKNPEIVYNANQSVQASWDVLVSYDLEAYKMKVLPALQKLLGDISKNKSASSLILKHHHWGLENGSSPDSRRVSANMMRSVIVAPISRSWFWSVYGYDETPMCRLSWDENNEFLFLLELDRNSSEGAERFAYYVLDKACLPALASMENHKPVVRVSLVDQQAMPVLEDEVDLNRIELKFDGLSNPGVGKNPFDDRRICYPNRNESVFCCVTRCETHGMAFKQVRTRSGRFVETSEHVPTKTYIVMRPMMRVKVGASEQQFYGNPVEFRWTKTLSLDQIKNIREIRCSVVDHGPNRTEQFTR